MYICNTHQLFTLNAYGINLFTTFICQNYVTEHTLTNLTNFPDIDLYDARGKTHQYNIFITYHHQ